MLTTEQRLQMRLQRSKPMWEELHVWLRVERQRVPDGSAIAKAIDYMSTLVEIRAFPLTHVC